MSRSAKLFAAGLVTLLLGAAVPGVGSVAQAAGIEKMPLRILYAGHPGSARETEYVAFLKEHFREVTTGDFATFKPEDARNADVVLLDYDGDGFKAPRPRLPESYSKPTLTIGVAGGLLCSNHRLKTGYL